MPNTIPPNTEKSFEDAKKLFAQEMRLFIKNNFPESDGVRVTQIVMNNESIEAYISAFPTCDEREKSILLAYLTGQTEEIPEDLNRKIMRHIYAQAIDGVEEIREEGLADFRVQRLLIWFPERVQRMLYPIVRKFF